MIPISHRLHWGKVGKSFSNEQCLLLHLKIILFFPSENEILGASCRVRQAWRPVSLLSLRRM